MGGSLVLLSGGMDSATLLYYAKEEQGRTPEAISFNYMQRHFYKEYTAAQEIAQSLGAEHHVVGLHSVADLLKESNSALVNPDVSVPVGHYAAENMAVTVVPNRNMMLLSIAVAVAMSRGLDTVYAGMHAGDHPIYPDCREEFVIGMDALVQIAMEGHEPPAISAPFVDLTKAEIARIGAELGVPFASTWSCYVGGDQHCGRCGTCVERREAFELADVKDPTIYQDSELYNQLKSEGKVGVR